MFEKVGAFFRPNETMHEIYGVGKLDHALSDSAKQSCVQSILFELLSFQPDHYIMHMDFLVFAFKSDIQACLILKKE